MRKGQIRLIPNEDQGVLNAQSVNQDCSLELTGAERATLDPMT